jgi:hypothetical protein
VGQRSTQRYLIVPRVLIENKLWLVMIGMDSILETAFPPESPNNYLSNKAFIFLGSLEDLVT